MIKYKIAKDRQGDPVLRMAIDKTDGVLTEQVLSIMAETATRKAVLTGGLDHLRQFIPDAGGHLNAGDHLINTINYYQLRRTDFRPMGEDNRSFYAGHGLTLEIHSFVPDHLIGSFAALMSETMNDIIRADDWELFGETPAGLQEKMDALKRAAVEMLVMVLLDEQGGLAGLSFVLVDSGRGQARQELTGIAGVHRGKKIAGRLKADITEACFRLFPGIDSIVTNCYSVNTPIIRINEGLGYSLAEQQHQLRVLESALTGKE